MKIRDNVKPSIPPIPGGNYLGICVYSIAVGEQLCEYEGKSKNYYKQVMLGFEICGKTIEHTPVTNVSIQGQPMAGFQNLQNIPGINFQALMQQQNQQGVAAANTPATEGSAPF